MNDKLKKEIEGILETMINYYYKGGTYEDAELYNEDIADKLLSRIQQDREELLGKTIKIVNKYKDKNGIYPFFTIRRIAEDLEKLKKSIKKFGFIEPMIVNKDYTLIGGHQRLKALKELGYEEVEVVKLDLNKQDEKKLNLRL